MCSLGKKKNSSLFQKKKKKNGLTVKKGVLMWNSPHHPHMKVDPNGPKVPFLFTHPIIMIALLNPQYPNFCNICLM